MERGLSKGISIQGKGEEKRINFFFFFNKGRNGRAVWKPDVIRYSVVIALDTRIRVCSFCEGGKRAALSSIWEKISDLPEASIVKSYKTITQKFRFMLPCIIISFEGKIVSNSKLFYIF